MEMHIDMTMGRGLAIVVTLVLGLLLFLMQAWLGS
jgi:hypothetical protein